MGGSDLFPKNKKLQSLNSKSVFLFIKSALNLHEMRKALPRWGRRCFTFTFSHSYDSEVWRVLTATSDVENVTQRQGVPGWGRGARSCQVAWQTSEHSDPWPPPQWAARPPPLYLRARVRRPRASRSTVELGCHTLRPDRATALVGWGGPAPRCCMSDHGTHNAAGARVAEVSSGPKWQDSRRGRSNTHTGPHQHPPDTRTTTGDRAAQPPPPPTKRWLGRGNRGGGGSGRVGWGGGVQVGRFGVGGTHAPKAKRWSITGG